MPVWSSGPSYAKLINDAELVAGQVGGVSPGNATHTAEHTAFLGSHGSGQLADQFDGSASHADRALFRFRLTNNTQAAVTVDQLDTIYGLSERAVAGGEHVCLLDVPTLSS